MNKSNYQNITSRTVKPTPQSVQIIRFFCIPIWAIIIIVGLVGNILTIKVLRFRHIKSTSTAVYLTALAVVDLLYLICSTNVSLIDYIFFFPSSVRHTSAILCHVVPVLQYSLSHFSAWLVVAVTFDRMILVVLPFSSKTFSNQKMALIVIITILTIIISVNLHFLWTMTYDKECNGLYFTENVFPYVDLALMGIAPFMAMIFCNLAIILKLRTQTKIREKTLKKTTASPLNPGTSNNHDNKPFLKNFKDKAGNLTKMLLCTNLFFMLSMTPLLVYDIVYFLIDAHALLKENEQLWGGVLFGIERLVYTIWYLNFCIHFFVYCLSGPNFRDEAMKILKLKKSEDHMTNVTKTYAL